MVKEMREKEEIIDVEILEKIVAQALDDHKTVFKRLSEI